MGNQDQSSFYSAADCGNRRSAPRLGQIPSSRLRSWAGRTEKRIVPENLVIALILFASALNAIVFFAG